MKTVALTLALTLGVAAVPIAVFDLVVASLFVVDAGIAFGVYRMME